nr:perilipin-2-like [Pogona vitticeps]
MSSAEEETKTASPESTEEEHWCVLKKVSDLPLVSSTYEMVSASYTSAKESHPAIQAVCDMAEVGVKAIATTAASGAQPLLDKLEPQIAVVDNIACKSLDKLQETLPVVQQAVEKVMAITSEEKATMPSSLAFMFRVTALKTLFQIKYTKRSVDQKVQDKLQRMWQEWIKGQPSQTSEANQVEMESRALKISHNIAQKMQANCLKLLADMQGLPDALKEKVQQAHNNMEELQAALSKANSFEDVPSGFLKESQEKIDKAQAAVQEVMEYVTKNAPLTWVVGPFSPAGASSGESAEREENTKAAA